MTQPSWQLFPSDLPKPEDDGACAHLSGKDFPSILLPSTAGSSVDPAKLSGITIIFCYPRTAAPNETVPDSWNEIPGARGCTPQACSFRDAAKEFLGLGVSHIFGASTQDTPYQSELKERIHLPYQLLSDEKLDMAKALGLPLFDWEGKKLLKRLTLAIEDGKIVKNKFVYKGGGSDDEELAAQVTIAKEDYESIGNLSKSPLHLSTAS